MPLLSTNKISGSKLRKYTCSKLLVSTNVIFMTLFGEGITQGVPNSSSNIPKLQCLSYRNFAMTNLTVSNEPEYSAGFRNEQGIYSLRTNENDTRDFFRGF